ncbi:MAG: hypothetical protein R3322_00425 [Kiloniellales bacterium]|nr:hypothetical protein [Kiloniellales bacterium]
MRRSNEPRLYDYLMVEGAARALPKDVGPEGIAEEAAIVARILPSMQRILSECLVIDVSAIRPEFSEPPDPEGAVWVPPWHTTWLEWRVFEFGHMTHLGAVVARLDDEGLQAFLGRVASPPRLRPGEVAIVGQMYARFSAGGHRLLPQLPRNRHGYNPVIVIASHDGAMRTTWQSYGPSPVAAEEEEALAAEFLRTVGYAFTVLACKNTRTVDVEPSEKLQRARRKRKKRPLVTYKTIEIDLSKTPSRYPRSAAPEAGAPVRQHRRRAHIRDYRKGKGLFGKYKGLFYVGPALVGSKEEGSIVTDYKLTRSKNDD